jgi:DNA topoisomerase-3
MERSVYDLIARRFIAAFYPDCRFSSTTVMGVVDGIVFKATGRQIIDPGWRVIFAKEQNDEDDKNEQEKVLPNFVKGESGPHVPDLNEKWTQPPRPYTEATLLRAMETAGKLVDNDELRDALKENGIGRPSTRAAIIETLFKRNYIRKEKKNLIATPTGVELIQLIHEELLKSAELTGIWEKKLREIERRSYDARQFIDELKQMVQEVVNSVLSDNSNRRITVAEPSVLQKALDADKKEAAAAKKRTRKPAAEGEEKKPRKKREPKSVAAEPRKLEIVEGRACPVCGKGIIIKGKAAFGCSEWRNGCTFRHPFEVENKQ